MDCHIIKTINDTIRKGIEGNCNVVIIGGGPSGIMAAITAAESGANTLLIEKGKNQRKTSHFRRR
uniref:FAD-binding protein n=1 Tax=Virgibacillus proomii TaxID=84407 RepID=UPI0035A10C6D